MKKKVDHLLQNGEIYNIEVSEDTMSIVVKNKRLPITLDNDINLDPTGDTVQILEIDGEYYADNLGNRSILRFKEKEK